MKQMNILIKAATVLIGATMLMAGCVNEDIRYDDDNKTKPENVGYLSLSGLNVEVMSDTEVITGVKSHTPTRAESVDPSDFTVDIVSNKTGEVVTSFKYADKPSEPIALEVGNYTLNVYSGKAPDMAWETPTYGASKEFVITRLKETSLGRIVCKLSSIKISVTYSADIIDMLRNGKKLPERNRDHALTGEYRGMRECHIAPDWLLIYRIDAGSLILVLSRTGSHSELFR